LDLIISSKNNKKEREGKNRVDRWNRGEVSQLEFVWCVSLNSHFLLKFLSHPIQLQSQTQIAINIAHQILS